MKDILYRIYRKIGIYLKSLYTQIDNTSILFVPHMNCANDNYDIINYKSDNVLCLFNSILRDSNFADYHLYVAYFDETKLDEYLNYCKPFNASRVHFVNYYDYFILTANFLKCKYVFTDEIYRSYKFKNKKQKVICLNYYPFPYKSDYVKLYDKHANKYQYPREQARINKYYDYLVSVSDIASVAIIQSEPFYYEKCLTLGFPRSDIFYTDNSAIRQQVVSVFPFYVKKIFIYVPTHRDYENKNRAAYDKNVKVRTIWGEESIVSVQKLEKFLQDENAIIIAKVHPAQAREVLSEQKTERIITYHELTSRFTVSLNELLAISDIMITDYTSAVFDFLMRDRPIVYYHYDIEKYDRTRGFFINPMTPLCVGETCYNLEELIKVLERTIKGVDVFKEKRKFLLDLLVTYKDSYSTSRIKDFFFRISDSHKSSC